MEIKTQPRYIGFSKIFSGASCGTGGVVSDTFSMKRYEGSTVLWIEPSSTSTHGDVTVKVELYNEKTGSWGVEASGGDLSTTIAAANITTSNPIYYSLGLDDKWVPADKARITLTAASGSFVFDGYIAGQ